METAQEVLDAPAAAPVISTEVAEYNPIAATLNELRRVMANRAYNLQTVKGNEEARSDRKKLVSLRTGLEKLRLDANRGDRATIEERIKLRDAEAERITEAIRELETPIDEQIKADEQRRETERQRKLEAEQQRIAALQARVDQIRGVATRAVGKPAAEIAEKIRIVVAIEVGTDFQELQPVATQAHAETLATLRELHARAVEQEAEAARLAAERADQERQRAEQAERDRVEHARIAAEQQAEAERLAEQRRQLEADQRAARERQEAEDAERRAEQARLDADAAAARRAADEKAAAERAEADRVAREAREAEEQRLADERAELQRQQAEQDRIVREAREAEEARQAEARAEQRRVEEAAATADKRVRDAAQVLLAALVTLANVAHRMDLENQDARPTEEEYQAALAQADAAIAEATGA